MGGEIFLQARCGGFNNGQIVGKTGYGALAAIDDFGAICVVPDEDGTVFLFEVLILLAVSIDEALVENIVQEVSGEGGPESHRAVAFGLQKQGEAVALMGYVEPAQFRGQKASIAVFLKDIFERISRIKGLQLLQGKIIVGWRCLGLQ